MACDFEWIGLCQWWLNLDNSGQAAWAQGVVSIIAIGVAIFIPYWQRRSEQEKKMSHDRKVVMSAAANLDIALEYEAAAFDFAPRGDGDIGHDFTLEQAREFMKLRPQTREALKSALEKSHYFSEPLCESVVRLGIEAAAYERIIDDLAHRTDNSNADEFFRNARSTNEAVITRIEQVRYLLKSYLPRRQ